MTYLSPIRQGGEAEWLAPWGQEPGRLWSLWDIMKPFYADQFFQLGARLEEFSGPFWRKVPIWLIRRNNWIHNTWGWARPQFTAETQSWVKTLFLTLREDCVDLDLDASVATIDRLLPLLAEKNVRWREVFEMSGDLKLRLHDQLKNRKFLHLNAAESGYYEAPTKGWDDVVKMLPSAAYDIEEASKCFALSRSTASAFHSIRCLEAGIRAASRSLGIADPTKGAERSWMKALGSIKAEVDKRWPSSGPARLSGDGRFFEEFYGALSGMQNPYRNATMHLDHNYTADEAEHIFLVVKGIMQKVASRMDEMGEPKA
jgi:hypothetical protein